MSDWLAGVTGRSGVTSGRRGLCLLGRHRLGSRLAGMRRGLLWNARLRGARLRHAGLWGRLLRRQRRVLGSRMRTGLGTSPGLWSARWCRRRTQRIDSAQQTFEFRFGIVLVAHGEWAGGIVRRFLFLY